ncbi:hypothetical protein [Hymenobacter properus]|uniref:Uncharacterized protein n=1 Tax=Hymenobacter properus TaxID=2791026 RepID=A0A931BCS5_9BACT|nr:hypothetical protein [Hymenobacter properus]MBF9140914.1 hypothetical protein [Hymenobacter properus]MBR7719723.1 hypothetical protein [Microvirga sp. SRT04]
MRIPLFAAPNGQPKLRSSEVLYRFFTVASVASLALSLWAAPYYEANQQPGFWMGLALYNAVGVCPLLVFLQFITGFYLSVRDFEKPVDKRRLVYGTLLSLVVFWANLFFGVAGPFFDSWD